VLPAFPFLFIWASRSMQWFSVTRARLPKAIAVTALAWSITSSLWYFPHSLSYFNEIAGGPPRGHEHLLDSNISWGQDLLYLKKWYDAHPEARPIHLATFSLVNPRFAGVDFELPGTLKPGWYVIDVNYLHGSHHPVLDHEGRFTMMKRHDLTYFQRFEPVDRIGYSLYIYYIATDNGVPDSS
jgi:hypothetical protein